MEYIKRILWEEVKKEGPVNRWFGRVNGRLMFEIFQFKNDMFTDPFIMTSKVIPMEMSKDDDVEELKERAQILMEAFVKSFYIP